MGLARFLLKSFLGRLSRLLSMGLARTLMFFQKGQLYLVAVSLATFTGFFSNLYRFTVTFEISFLWEALFSLALTLGGSVDRFLTGLKLVRGVPSGASAALEKGFLSGMPVFFQKFLQTHSNVLGVFLVVTALSVPFVYNRSWNAAIRFFESTDPAMGHNLLKFLLFLSLVLVYSVIEQGGVGYVANVFDSFDSVLGSLVEQENVSVSNNSSLKPG